MKKYLNKLCLLIVSSLLITGCNDSSNNQSYQDEYTNSNTHGNMKKDFRYTWLENITSDSISEEDSLFDENYYFVLDISGSMNDRSCNGSGYKIDIAKKAISDYIKTLPEDANIGLLVFSGGSHVLQPLAKNNKPEIIKQLSRVSAGGSTALRTAMESAYDQIKLQAVSQASHGEYNMIVVTDGEANIGENPSSIVNEISYNSPVNINTIGFCINGNHSLNNKNLVNYYSASNYQSIMDGLSTVYAESDGMDDQSFLEGLDYLSTLN